MAILSFVPQIWYSKVMQELTPHLVGESIVNHDVDGEVMFGGSVKINRIGSVELKAYDGSPITYSDMDTSAETLTINHSTYEAKTLDDVDAVQSRDGGQLMASYTKAMAIAIADDLDKETFKEVAGAATAENTIGDDTTPISISSASDAKALLLDLIGLADAANVPVDGRVVVVGPKFKGLLLADPYINISPAKAEETLRKGYLGELYGCEIYWSNNLPKTTGNNDQIILTHPYFTTEVHQLSKIEAIRLETSFKEAVRCLSVSGVKTIYKEGVCKGVINFQ